VCLVSWPSFLRVQDLKNQTLFYTSVSGDFRASIGYSHKHFFMLLNTTSDFSWYNASQITFLSRYGAVNFLKGARNTTKPRKKYRKIQ
jgi:hypothetical protein